MTKIQWTDETWNPVRGCSIVSEGCRHCYAMRHAHRMNHEGGAYEGLTKMTATGPKWTGQVRTVPELLDRPLRWRKPRRIFVNSMSDLFHPDVPEAFIDHVFAIMGRAYWHVFQVLTKRPERMRRYCSGLSRGRLSFDGHRFDESWPLPFPNVWLGTSVEDQATADERIPHLLATPAAVRWLSCEPLLGEIDLIAYATEDALLFPLTGEFHPDGRNEPLPIEHGGIHWVVVGGESGPGARPCDLTWIRPIVEQCREAGVPVFVKQLGANVIGDGWHSRPSDLGGHRNDCSNCRPLRDRKGGDPSEWPEDLRIREYPLATGVRTGAE